MAMKQLRQRLHRQLDPQAWRTNGLSPLNTFLVIAILVATASAIIQTEPTLSTAYAEPFRVLELGLGILFGLEYLGRLWTIPDRQPNRSALSQRVEYALQPAALLDLFTVLITLLPFITINVMALRLIRLLRILRLAKLRRMSAALRLLYDVVGSRKYELAVTLALALTVLILGASALYWIEGSLQPEQFGSIPRALWWAVITLTTIGYGDAYPITAAGKFVAAIVAISGIGLIAMPTGILASAFGDAVRRKA